MTATNDMLQRVRAAIDEQEAAFPGLCEGVETIDKASTLETFCLVMLNAWTGAFGGYIASEMLRAMLFGYFLRGKCDGEMIETVRNIIVYRVQCPQCGRWGVVQNGVLFPACPKCNIRTVSDGDPQTIHETVND